MDDYNSLESNREDTETIPSLFLVYFLWLLTTQSADLHPGSVY